MTWIKKLIASKISVEIKIIHSAEDRVVSTTTPRVIVQPIVKINKVLKSNFRFIEENKMDRYEKWSTAYYTEEHKKNSWSFVSNSLSHNKDEAMSLYLKLLDGRNISNVTNKTVLWEGLSKEEASSWVSLQCSSRAVES